MSGVVILIKGERAVIVTPPSGPPGRSAYAVALSNGFVGSESEWLASLVGPAAPASAIPFNDVLTDLGATNVQDAVVKLWSRLLSPQGDFSNPDNSGFGQQLGLY